MVDSFQNNDIPDLGVTSSATKTSTKTNSIALGSLLLIGFGGILVMLMATGTAASYGCAAGPPGRTTVSQSGRLNSDLHKIVPTPDALREGFSYSSITESPFDAVGANAGLTQEVTEQAINISAIPAPDDSQLAGQHFSVLLRRYGTVKAARTVFTQNKEPGARQPVTLPDSLQLGEEYFCTYYSNASSSPHDYYCGFRNANIFIAVNAKTDNATHFDALDLLTVLDHRLDTYSDATKPQHPIVSLLTPNKGELLTLGHYTMYWEEQNADRVVLSVVGGCPGCFTGTLFDSHIQGVRPGDLLRTPVSHAIHYVGSDRKRYVFPNTTTYFSWYDDYANLKWVDPTVVAEHPLGGTVTIRPGSKIVKIDADPTLYVIDAHGVLREVSPTIAAELYGSAWQTFITVVPDNFFVNYTIGTPVADAEDFDVLSIMDAATTIGEDKQLPDVGLGSPERVSQMYTWFMPPIVSGDDYYVSLLAKSEEYGDVLIINGPFSIISNYHY